MMNELIKIFKDKKFKRELAIILIVGIIVNALCFLSGTIYSNAATPTPFPYYCYNDTYNTAIMPYIDGVVQAVKDKWYENGDDPFIIVMGEVWWKDTDTSDPYWAAECYVFWECEFNDVLGESYASRPYEFLSHSSGNAHRFDIWLDTYRIYSYDNRVSGDFKLLGNQTIHQTTIGTYTWNYPIYVSEPIQTRIGAKNFTVIANSEASDPNGDLIGSISSLPGIDNILNGITSSYSNTALQQFPSYDSSISIGENIENYIDWLGNAINNDFNNLGSSISGYFNNLTSSLQNWLSSINNNIYNGFKNFTDNLSSFFKPYLDHFKDVLAYIKDRLDWIKQPLDTQQLSSDLNNCDFSSDFLGLTTTISSFATAFTSGTEPSSCSFTLDFSNSYYYFGVCEFSLDWILPFRSSIRLIVGCLCVYSLVVSIFTSLNTYIGGTSSINDDI